MTFSRTRAPLSDVWHICFDVGGTIDLRSPTATDDEGLYPIDPDAVTAMHRLTQLGRSLSVASNTEADRPRDKPLAAAGVTPLLMGVLQSHQLGIKKPDPRFFAKIITTFGYLPQHICYVGNRLDKDVLPALQARMRAVLVAPAGVAPATLPPDVPVIRHVRHLPDLFLPPQVRTS
ncbi:HAD family hydrolase [Actinomadura miaoliensis]|uniref:HAD family hydrolase n=1 Tax=Actinomadura miaoliensis TaxID=430685 RepID=A0ABP7W798_9ACTN